jgi:hypothetical protein
LIASRAGWAAEFAAAAVLGAALLTTAAEETAEGFDAIARRCVVPVMGSGWDCICADCSTRGRLLVTTAAGEEFGASDEAEF